MKIKLPVEFRINHNDFSNPETIDSKILSCRNFYVQSEAEYKFSRTVKSAFIMGWKQLDNYCLYGIQFDPESINRLILFSNRNDTMIGNSIFLMNKNEIKYRLEDYQKRIEISDTDTKRRYRNAINFLVQYNNTINRNIEKSPETNI
jgi:hypothetical protein